MVARGMMSGMMMPSALRRVCPCGESLTGVQIESAEVVDLASDDEDRVAYMHVDANIIIDGATHQSGTARSTY